MLDKLTLDDFTNRIGETFQATPQEGEPFELELRRADPSRYSDDEARGDKGKGDGPQRDGFSIEFHSRLPHHTPQQTVQMRHEQLGEFELFIVPLGPDAEGHRYEAVFG